MTLDYPETMTVGTSRATTYILLMLVHSGLSWILLQEPTIQYS